MNHEEIMRKFLATWPLYQATHHVQVTKCDDIVCLYYGEGPSQASYRELPTATYFDANMDGKIFYLLSIRLDVRRRRNRFGTMLYEVIEDIARAMGCNFLIQSPSGITDRGDHRRSYLLRRGYEPHGANEVIKNL